MFSTVYFPPLIIIVATRLFYIYKNLRGNVFSGVFAVLCIITFVAIPYTTRKDIREHTLTSLLVEQTLAEASGYTSDEVFITNTILITDSFDFDLSTTPAVAISQDEFKQSCPANSNCTMVLYKNPTRSKFYKTAHMPGCEKILINYEASILFWPIEMIEILPDVLFEQLLFEKESHVVHQLYHKQCCY